MATVVQDERLAEVVGIDEMARRAELREARQSVEVEKMCRITLAANYKEGEIDERRALILKWHGGQGHRQTQVTMLAPGKSITVPLGRAFGWFGPFHVLQEFKHESDPRKQERLSEFWKRERERVLLRWGYPMRNEGYRPNMTPIGPHRFPDVTIVMIDSNGEESPPIRCHRIYEIGEFDQNWPLDSFGPQETVEQAKSEAQAQLARVSEQYEQQMQELRREMAAMAGMVKGLAVAIPAAAAVHEQPPVAAGAGG